MTQPPPNGSAPQPGKPAFDPVNQWQGVLPLEWTTDALNLPQGQFAAVCFRMPNITVTGVLAKSDLDRFITDLQKLYAGMHGLILPPSGGGV